MHDANVVQDGIRMTTNLDVIHEAVNLTESLWA